jgi:glycosyltransferase involved in cell wall biosynthesis
MYPLVSILIPAYNSEKWIRATIQSALAQTWPRKEIIIIDDGSSDTTFKIAKQFESKSVKVLTQSNNGSCAARNRALSVSQGDFIQWLDSDDLLAPDKIELQLRNSDKNPQSRVLHSSAWGNFYFRLKRAKFNPNPLWQNLPPVDWLLKHLGGGYMMHPAAWLVSRELTALAGQWDERIIKNQDGEYFCRVVACSELVRFHPKSICYYRTGNLFSISRKRSEKALESLSLSYNLCIDHLLNLEKSETATKACVNFLQNFVSRNYNENSDIIKTNQNRIIELGGSIALPSETSKFIVARKIFGLKTARLLKIWLWNREIVIRKYWDKFLAILFNDGL